MIDDLWTVASFGPALCVGTAAAFAKRRRRIRRSAAAALTPPDDDKRAAYVPQNIEAAEGQLGMVLRRMRAYRRAPYDFAKSRIFTDTEFEHCLDLATALGIRIGELSGALSDAPEERERIRHQILQSVSSEPVAGRSGPNAANLGQIRGGWPRVRIIAASAASERPGRSGSAAPSHRIQLRESAHLLHMTRMHVILAGTDTHALLPWNWRGRISLCTASTRSNGSMSG
jgi:hypothetical protein